MRRIVMPGFTLVCSAVLLACPGEPAVEQEAPAEEPMAEEALTAADVSAPGR